MTSSKTLGRGSARSRGGDSNSKLITDATRVSPSGSGVRTEMLVKIVRTRWKSQHDRHRASGERRPGRKPLQGFIIIASSKAPVPGSGREVPESPATIHKTVDHRPSAKRHISTSLPLRTHTHQNPTALLRVCGERFPRSAIVLVAVR